MKVRNIIAAVMAVPVIFGCAGAYPAAAEMVTPTIAQTYKWKTEYYIDGKKDEEYNFLECIAEVYNDGSVRVYFHNSVDWSKLAPDDTSIHTVTIKQLCPDRLAYSFVQECTYPSGNPDDPDLFFPISKERYDEGEISILYNKDADYTFWKDYNRDDLGTYPANYRMTYGDDSIFRMVPQENYFYGKAGSISRITGCLYQFEYEGRLSELPQTSSVLTFRPIDISKEEYTICVFDQYINIYPEMLSDELFRDQSDFEKKINELEARIDELEAENEALKALNDPDSILRLDANGDGIIDSNDASIILTIYAINSTGGNVSKISELPGGEV